MRKFCGFIFVISIVAGATHPAQASIDQRCLALCANGGKAQDVCLPQCTYDKSAAKPGTEPGTANPHKVLNAPQPLSELVLPKSKTAKPVADKDYACVAQCQQSGQSYRQCNQSCVKTECKVGDTRCHDLLGAVPGTLPPSPLERTITH